MSKIHLENKEWCELVFENRNQAYGAYELRKNYSKNTSKAFLFTLLFLCLGGFAPLIAGFIGDITAPETAFKSDDRVILVDLPPKLEEEEIIIPKTTTTAAPASTIRDTEFRIVPNNDPEAETPPSNDEISKGVAGAQSLEGNSDDPVDLTGLDNGTTIAVTESSEEPVLFVSDMPEFIGGEEAMMDYISDNFVYPPTAREIAISGTVYINFVVEKDGSISQVSIANPNRILGYGCEEEAIRVIKSMPDWKPGKQNGVNRRVQFTIPIKLNLL